VFSTVVPPARKPRGVRPLVLLIVIVCVIAAGVLVRVSSRLGSALTMEARHGLVRATTAFNRPRPTTPLYVAIGASDSYGVGADNPTTQSWPAVLDSYLPPGTYFTNLGVPGIRLGRALAVELPIAVDARPDLVTVWLAVNDLAAGVPLTVYRHQLDILLGTLQRRTHAHVLVANLPNLSLVPALAAQPGVAGTVAAWNAAIAAEADAHGAVLVDLYTQWTGLAVHPEDLGPDGLHPSTLGYRRLGELFWQTYRLHWKDGTP